MCISCPNLALPIANLPSNLRLTGAIVLINKPQGWSSHQVVAWLRRQTGIQKIGHAGTLDPLATGLLIILIGRMATKLQPKFLQLSKEYECTAQFGSISSTLDSTGAISCTLNRQNLEKLTLSKIKTAIQTFIGEINQQVPDYSAVKIDGKPLYAYHCEKKFTDCPVSPIKKVIITQIATLSWQHPNWTFRCSVSSGTYIRSLVNDIGKKLGCGAMVTALKRTQIGKFGLDQASKPDENPNWLPISVA